MNILEPTKTYIEKVQEAIKAYENIEPSPMTKEEEAKLIQRQINLCKNLIDLENSKQFFLTKFLEHQNHVFKLDAEIAIAEEFISSKGLRDEYRKYAERKMKVLYRKQKKKSLKV